MQIFKNKQTKTPHFSSDTKEMPNAKKVEKKKQMGLLKQLVWKSVETWPDLFMDNEEGAFIVLDQQLPFPGI